MTLDRNRRWAYGILAVAAAFFVAFYVAPGLLASSDGKSASGDCVPQNRVGLDHGEHQGRPWRITAGVEKNPNCSFWMLKVEVSPEGKEQGSWTGGWGIPADGHLPLGATIGAGDYPEGEARALGGVVGSRVRSVLFKMSGGRTLVVHPKSPSGELLTRFAWLHDLRYFFRFYPSGEKVKFAKLLDGTGKVITIVQSREGVLEGFMGVV